MLRVVALALFVLFVDACTVKSDPTCNIQYSCGSGQTCWTGDGTNFACGPSGAGALGAACAPTAGTATCGDGLACTTVGDAGTPSFCRAWCAADDKCPPSQSCVKRSTSNGVDVHLCMPCNLSYACAAGQTCASTTGTSFTCVTAGGAKEGDGCDASVGAALTCGDHLACVSSSGDPTVATCVRWCAADRTCSDGKTCQSVMTTKGEALLLCL